ncbi:hypothetical protein J6A31_04570 [bacterium]|nr:hypothetical protein [bacterium]
MNNQTPNQKISDKLLAILNVINTLDDSTDETLIKNICKQNNIPLHDFYTIYNATKRICETNNSRTLESLMRNNRISTVIYGKLKHDFKTIDDFGKYDLFSLCKTITSKLSSTSLLIILSLMIEFNVSTTDKTIDELQKVCEFIQLLI